MLRCVTLAALLVAFVGPAAAQAPRNFPGNALRGEIVVIQPPELFLNKRPARLAPGARVRSQQNLSLVTGALADQRLVVNYTLDPNGLLLNVWILTAEEIARRPWPTTPEEAAAWQFDAAAQTWTKP
jgi:hypothetical protein